ncbi:MAG: outer membrane lipoprotein chaperone LolA [Pseudomonadales bacterium]|nr:outer membrane lipoprotein chaperone LolA [Pseudomonadales bacterium]
MIRHFFGALIGLLLGMQSVIVLAGQAETKQLNALLASINSMDAEFSQLVLDARGGVIQEVNGQLTIQRPYKFRWITGAPFFQNVISNGQLLWVHDLDLEQVTVQTLDRSVGNTPALLLSGDPEQIGEAFEINREISRASGSDSGKEIIFRLLPKHEDGLFESLRVTFLNDVLVEMYLKDSLGQQTTIEFKTVKTNITIAPGVFEFTPPKGVDIIEDF